MSSDQSFNATGPTVTAFETIGPTPGDVPEFGVAVYAHKCGVNGVAFSDVPTNAHLIAPDLVGVHGKGDNEGVQGEGPIGVHGIGQAAETIIRGGTGVWGEGGHVGVQGNGGDIGVLGQGGQAGVQGEGSVGVSGAGSSAGVRGFSKRSRGGVFQTGQDDLPALGQFGSKISAQILLVPVQVQGLVESHLPRTGHAGDLLAIFGQRVNPLRQVTETTVELWFCVGSGSNNPPEPGAVWAKLQFEKTFNVP